METEPEPVSQSEYGVTVHHDLMLEVRDGTRLATDVYRPSDPETGEPIEEPKPALVVRTPYNKRTPRRINEQGRWYAKRGYVVAIQDVRGRYNSEGEFYFLLNEPEDGYDSVEWIAEKPYCDGQVGTMGTSYMAWVQSALATLDPPSLSAMFVNQGAANGWEATLRHNGTFEMRWLTWALTVGGGFSKRSLQNAEIQRTLANVDTGDVCLNEPVIKGESPLRFIPNYEEWLFDFMTSKGTDEIWDSRGVNFTQYIDESSDVPTVYAGGWYDSYGKATTDSYSSFSKAKNSDHYLIMGPWTHGSTTAWNKPYSGEAWFGESAVVDYLKTKLAFFDQYLKNADTWDLSPVTYYRMSTCNSPTTATATGSKKLHHGGDWDTDSEWPLSDTLFIKYFAHPDGTLKTDPPSTGDSSTTYKFDPKNPVPTLGGNCSSYYTFENREEPIEELPLTDRPTISITGRGGYDQKTRPSTFGADPPYGPLEERNDVITYRTPPLEEPVEIVGPIIARVYASTDAADTDFTAKLIDEYPPSSDYPGGFSLNLCDSICRAKYRGYRRDPDPIEPEEIYQFVMEPYPTGNIFSKGHRIRLDISSSNFPRYDVNDNTNERPPSRKRSIAFNTIYHEEEHPTHIELPVQPRS